MTKWRGLRLQGPLAASARAVLTQRGVCASFGWSPSMSQEKPIVMSEPQPRVSGEPSAGVCSDRRAYVRLASDLSATCTASGRAGEPGWAARVRDISPGGVGLILEHRFRPGTRLSLELRARTGELLQTVQARVAHATAILEAGNPCWLLGCAFDRPLSDDEFAALQ